jgi:predicted ester cyclase
MTPGSVAGAGLDHLKTRARSLFTAFPAVKFGVEDVVQQDDTVAARVTLEGTQRAEFAGIPATGHRMKVYDFAMYRIAGGKITDVWSLIDIQAMRDQLQGGSGSPGHFR